MLVKRVRKLIGLIVKYVSNAGIVPRALLIADAKVFAASILCKFSGLLVHTLFVSACARAAVVFSFFIKYVSARALAFVTAWYAFVLLPHESRFADAVLPVF